jgi:hypothetical protein
VLSFQCSYPAEIGIRAHTAIATAVGARGPSQIDRIHKIAPLEARGQQPIVSALLIDIPPLTDAMHLIDVLSVAGDRHATQA